MQNYDSRGENPIFLESQMTHPTHADGLVDSGDPVMVGAKIAGVASTSAKATTDKIAIQTKGVFNLAVKGHNGAANTAIAVGDQITMNQADGLLNVDPADPKFGVALDPVVSGATTVIRVAVYGFVV